MSAIASALVGFAALTVLLLGVAFVRPPDSAAIVWACCAGGATVLCGIVAAIILGGRASGATVCGNWARQTGITTKFVVLNWNDGGTCLARTPSGRWVPKDQWAAFVRGTP